jgi:bilin biosynthesis protein
VRAVLDATATIFLCVLLIAGPAVGILVLRDRRRARRFVPVCVSCGHAGPRGTPTPERCPGCGEDPTQRRVLRELGPEENTEDEAIRRVVIAKHYKDVDYLIEALRDTDPVVRQTAARYLGLLEASEAIPALTRLLRAANPGTRSAAATALGRIRAEKVFPDLIELVENDPDIAVQTHAIGALGEIGDLRAATILVARLESDDWLVRAAAARALGTCGDQAVVNDLRRRASTERWLLRGPYRKAVRRIRRRSRPGWLQFEWWPLGWKARRRLLAFSARAVVFMVIFLTLLKVHPGL